MMQFSVRRLAPLAISLQVAELHHQCEQRHTPQADALQAATGDLSTAHVQKFQVKVEQQDRLDRYKQGSEDVEYWQAWPKQGHK
eukprot:4978740-Amphidinium_carterae.1